MPLITFTSDFGNSDHYVASVKAGILSKDPSIQIIDISHDIKPFDIPHLAFVVNSIFRQFPPGTIHLLGLNDTNKGEDAYLGVELEEHLFLLPDNGLVGLLSNKAPTQVVRLDTDIKSLFPALDILAPTASELAHGKKLHALGEPITEYNRMVSRQVKATRKEIAGHVVRVDQYGNLITNILKTDFDILSKDKGYTIHAGRETVSHAHNKYSDVEPGDLFFVFNSLGLLEIGINQGNASQLLGLGFDAPVNIQFQD